MNNNLLLYGSIARGDATSASDVDLLSVVSDNQGKITHQNLNISLYQAAKLVQMAESGSLFLYHLNKEAKILIDEDKILSEIIYNRFKRKPTYKFDVAFAKQLLIDILSRYEKTNNYSYANSMIAWCMRTTCAAIGAENDTPIFSAKGIGNHFGQMATTLLEIRRKEDYQLKEANNCLQFINHNWKNIPSMKLSEFSLDLIKFHEKVIARLDDVKGKMNHGYT